MVSKKHLKVSKDIFFEKKKQKTFTS